MARPSKENKEKKEEDSTAVVTVNIDDFTRTRDSVIISLATLQSAVSDLSRAYINHANTILNRGPATLDLGSVTTSLFENGILANAQAAIAAGAAGAVGGVGASQDESGEPKKRKRKRVHDPNAPKRALTPYFLYMKINRPLIAKELGETAKPKDIADEGAKRWGAMSDSEKQVWKDRYQANLAVYHEKMKAYKAGQTVPEDDEAAQQLQQGINNAAESSSEVSSSSEEESSPEPEPEPVKEPTPPRQKRRRTLEAKNVAVESTPAKKGSPEKKKKGRTAEEKAPKTATLETPKSEKKKRKRKSQAHVEED